MKNQLIKFLVFLIISFAVFPHTLIEKYTITKKEHRKIMKDCGKFLAKRFKHKSIKNITIEIFSSTHIIEIEYSSGGKRKRIEINQQACMVEFRIPKEAIKEILIHP